MKFMKFGKALIDVRALLRRRPQHLVLRSELFRWFFVCDRNVDCPNHG